MNIEHLKVGDRVAYYNSRRWTIATITGETKQQWLAASSRFWKKNGNAVGRGDWNTDSIEALTPEFEKEIETDRKEREHRIVWNRIRSLSQPYHVSLERLMEIYNECKEQK